MAAPKLILSDVAIADAAVKYWPLPTNDYYQAKVMTTIALMESNGDAFALLMNVPPSLLAYYVDRGLWGINEGAIAQLLGHPVDGATFADPDRNAAYARTIWDWRYNKKFEESESIAQSLVYAYEGWTTYRKARIEKDPAYVAAWNARWPRAVTAVQAITI